MSEKQESRDSSSPQKSTSLVKAGSSSLDSPKLYDKICKYKHCQKPFQHQSRNKRYCCEECETKARKHASGRAKARRKYRKDPEKHRLASLSRKQAREWAINNLVTWPCHRCGELFLLKDMECHHRDGDHMNNDPENLALVCDKCHAKLDSEWREAKKKGLEIPDCRNYRAHGIIVTKDGNGETRIIP